MVGTEQVSRAGNKAEVGDALLVHAVGQVEVVERTDVQGGCLALCQVLNIIVVEGDNLLPAVGAEGHVVLAALGQRGP